MSAYSQIRGAGRTEPGNLLLAGLPRETVDRLSPHMRQVELSRGFVLIDAAERMEHAYFPETAVVSLLHVMSDGASTEIAVVGNDGVVGLQLFLGGGPATCRAVVQSTGTAIRVPAAVLTDAFARGDDARWFFHRYAQAVLVQTAQTAACNRHHTIDQQLCRWLLARLDRMQMGELATTQELIANMLGVRREGVTVAAAQLQRDGLISYTRGHIHVLDRNRLEKRACECYAVMQRESRRLLPWLGSEPAAVVVGQEKGPAGAPG